jgi:ABC-type transporter Mla subunit MlaD
VALGFALSCFGLLLFLWITFGGPIPLAPKSYRFTADFQEGITLQKESDVRIGGVSVGKVKSISLPEGGNATRATIEIDPQYAPISSDARAILRQKTLLGEAYVELTSGDKNTAEPGAVTETTTSPTSQVGNVDSLTGDDAVEPIPEGGHLADSQVQDQVQIDEIFNALDEKTRNAFRVWQQNLAIGSKGRGTDLSDAFGNLGPFSEDAAAVLRTLNRQGDALSQTINSTGQVFAALTARDQQLAGLIHGNNQTFGALASRDQQLAEAIKIFPTFNSETRKLLTRLESFSVNARPLARDLKPVARDLSPTLADVRRLAPHAKSLFTNLDPLITAALAGLPQTRAIVHEAHPVLTALDPFLANLNPILRYLSAYSGNVTDFIANPSAGLADTLAPVPGQPAPRHALRQIGYISPESLTIYPTRQNYNRGNSYLPPNGIGNPQSVGNNELFPSHDCRNTGNGGNGFVTPTSAPNKQTPGIFPTTVNGSFPASIFPSVIPGLQAFASCTIVPSPFGGGAVPVVPQDP